MSVKLFLIRHGQTDWTLNGMFQGRKDTKLTSLGINQAKFIAKYLTGINFSVIYSSPLERTLETAKIILKNRNIKILIDENLKEANYGKWEGLKYREVRKQYKEDYNKWLLNPFCNTPPYLESYKSVAIRADKVIKKIIKKSSNGDNIIIVTHGGVIISLLVYWLGIPFFKWRSIVQNEGAINIITVDNGFKLISLLNYIGYLKLSDIVNDKECLKLKFK